ncbi:hypothetical protein V2H45_02750 [Tumidithrix elongata RA019]|uniref:Uncharacterized protein n=1 Tax=Tumidithrix elongata BACA0141 TaxID=2716417 RepID=A0AAW9PWM4_9CYAN|nr:hypothetical protein [Tumidithrix elongata RA019]
MKKQLSLAIAICTILLAGGITACTQANSSATPQATSSPVSSVPSDPSPSSTATSTPSDTSQTGKPTDTERAQRREARRKQIEEVLTPEQVQQLQAKLKQGEKMQKALSELNLTTEQKTKIQIIFEKSYAKTPDSAPGKSQ